MDRLNYIFSINDCFKFLYLDREYFVKGIDVYENGIDLIIIRYVDYEKAANFYKMYVSREKSLSEEEIKEALSISPFRGILNLKSVVINGIYFNKISKTSGVYVKDIVENRRCDEIIERCHISRNEKISFEYTTAFINTENFDAKNIDTLLFDINENKNGEKKTIYIKDCNIGDVFYLKNYIGKEYALTIAEKINLKAHIEKETENLIGNMEIEEGIKKSIEKAIMIGFDISPDRDENDDIVYEQKIYAPMVNIGIVSDDKRKDGLDFKTICVNDYGEKSNFEIYILSSCINSVKCEKV